ncbi:MAG: type I-U CRISPR-associated protein Csx17, partial [Planctomycetota bacterium]
MTLHLHRLNGCQPTPLAHYLKALGILRLVAEQADASARGWWQDEHFCLLTTLDRSALEQFFLEEYAPTPFIDPWNGGSGFFPKDNKAGIDPIKTSSAARFDPYRQAIAQGAQATKGMKAKPDAKKDKPRILQEAARNWRGT